MEKYVEILKKRLAFCFRMCYYTLALEQVRYAPVAQLDRVTDYESVGRGFESLPAYHLTGYPKWDNLLNLYVRKRLEQSYATVRWTVAADGLTEANLYFLSLL